MGALSISFEWRKFRNLIDFLLYKQTSVVDCDDVPKLKGSKHRVLFQNAEGNINMGVFFNDPDVDLDEIFWYNELAENIKVNEENEGLISIDEKLNTRSCYVELHRKGLIIRLLRDHRRINWIQPITF